jgi:hypothetical protein
VQHSLLTLVTSGPEQSAHAAVRVAVLSDMKIPTLTATVGHGELSVQHSLLTLVTSGPEQSAHAAVRAQ